MSTMLLEKNGGASSSSRTKRIEIRYLFTQDRIEKGDIGLEYCHTKKMVAGFMTKPFKGGGIFEFRDRIIRMSDNPGSENNVRGRKVRDAIARENTESTQMNGGFESKQSEPAGVRWKSENRFEILKDDDNVID